MSDHNQAFTGVDVQEFDGSIRLSEFLDPDENHVMVMPMIGCLGVFASDGFVQLVEQCESQVASGDISLEVFRKFLLCTEHTQVSNNGVIQVTDEMSTRCELGDTVVIIGAGNHIRIWNPTVLIETVRVASSTDSAMKYWVTSLQELQAGGRYSMIDLISRNGTKFMPAGSEAFE